jgi:hypothetical protein
MSRKAPVAKTEAQAAEPSINVNGKSYPITSLPADIRDLIAVYQVWENELLVQRREVFKLEGAIRSVSTELETRFKNIEAQAVAASQVLPSAIEAVAATAPANDPA